MSLCTLTVKNVMFASSGKKEAVRKYILTNGRLYDEFKKFQRQIGRRNSQQDLDNIREDLNTFAASMNPNVRELKRVIVERDDWIQVDIIYEVELDDGFH